MNKKCIPLIVIACVLMTTQAIFAVQDKDHEMPPPFVGSAQLEKMKNLVGRWEGNHQMGEETKKVTATYHVTSNGSAIVETLFPGTEEEMVSVYYDEQGKLTMTHYCALGNRPEMSLTDASDNQIELKLSDNSSIDVNSEGHMHGLTIIFDDDGSIKHSWTMFQEGKEAGKTDIQLTRVGTKN